MNELQKRMLEQRLSAIADICNQIGPKFDLAITDSEGNIWRFNIELEEMNDE